MPSRRSFLGSLAALAVAPFVPTPTRHERIPVSMVRLAREAQCAENYRIGNTITVRVPMRWKSTDSLQPHLHEAFKDA